MRRNCLFSSFVDANLLVLILDRPRRLKKPLLINFFALAAVDEDVDGDGDGAEIAGSAMVLSDDVLTRRLFNGIGLLMNECRFKTTRRERERRTKQ